MGGVGRFPLPTGRLALLLFLGCGILPLAPVGQAWLWWLGYNGLLMLLAAADWLGSARAGDLTLTPRWKGHWVRGEVQPVSIQVENRSRRAVALELRQDLPVELGGPAPALRLAAEAAGSYETAPRERGDYALGDIHGRWRSRAGLLVMRGIWPQSGPVRVYAPLYLDRGTGLLAPRQRVQEQGAALIKAAGVHTEFESLRDYRPGDEARAVNWRASARRGRLVVNQYQAERTQQVMLVLDSGRLMVPEYKGIPRFEYALSAALQLGRLAASREDRVGMMLFGSEVSALLPPARGQVQVARLAEAAYRVKPEMIEPDYAGALARLSGSLKRRSLLLFFTDLVSPEVSQDLLEHLRRLVPRHLVVVLSVSDPAMAALAHTPEHSSVAEAYAHASADWVLEQRSAARAALSRSGITVLDVPPLQLSSAAINKYLEVKGRGAL